MTLIIADGVVADSEGIDGTNLNTDNISTCDDASNTSDCEIDLEQEVSDGEGDSDESEDEDELEEARDYFYLEPEDCDTDEDECEDSGSDCGDVELDETSKHFCEGMVTTKLTMYTGEVSDADAVDSDVLEG